MGKHLTRVKVGVVGAPGTGTISLGDPIRSDTDGDCLTIAEAGGVDGEVYSYVAIDGGNFAEGEAAWSSSGNVLGRDALEKRWNGTNYVTGKLNLSADAIVMLTPRAPDFIPDWSEITSKPSTFPPSAHDASLITSGTIDVARIPVLPSSLQIVSSGGIADLTSPQQADIGKGTIVTATDGRRFVYTGTGSKTSEASYIVLADITPEWSAIANKPTISTFALSLLDDVSASMMQETLQIKAIEYLTQATLDGYTSGGNIWGDRLYYTTDTKKLYRGVTGFTVQQLLDASGIPFTPTGTIAATNVQAAIAEVAAEAAPGLVPLASGAITSATASLILGSAYITTNFDQYELRLFNFCPANASSEIVVNFSTDDGATWLAGASEYTQQATRFGSSTATTRAAAATQIPLTGDIVQATTGLGFTGIITLNLPMVATAKTSINATGGFEQSDGTLKTCLAFGAHNTAAAVNAMRVKANSGNIASLMWQFYGVKK